MARGWESKSVEAQQDERIAASAKKSSKTLTGDERANLDRRRTLELARARTRADLDASSSAAHRKMLEQALKAIDDQLRELKP